MESLSWKIKQLWIFTPQFHRCLTFQDKASKRVSRLRCRSVKGYLAEYRYFRHCWTNVGRYLPIIYQPWSMTLKLSTKTKRCQNVPLGGLFVYFLAGTKFVHGGRTWVITGFVCQSISCPPSLGTETCRHYRYLVPIPVNTLIKCPGAWMCHWCTNILRYIDIYVANISTRMS